MLLLPVGPEDKRLQQIQLATPFVSLVAGWGSLAKAVLVCKPSTHMQDYEDNNCGVR